FSGTASKPLNQRQVINGAGLTKSPATLIFRGVWRLAVSAARAPRADGPDSASRTDFMSDPTAAMPTPRPPDCNAALVLADGTVFWGRGLGEPGQAVGEVCFNTAITGYQEILTDPSYAGQIITFTFPHIGNVGANHE